MLQPLLRAADRAWGPTGWPPDYRPSPSRRRTGWLGSDRCRQDSGSARASPRTEEDGSPSASELINVFSGSEPASGSGTAAQPRLASAESGCVDPKLAPDSTDPMRSPAAPTHQRQPSCQPRGPAPPRAMPIWSINRSSRCCFRTVRIAQRASEGAHKPWSRGAAEDVQWSLFTAAQDEN